MLRLEELVTKLKAANHSWDTQAKALPFQEGVLSDTAFSTGRLRFGLKLGPY